MWTRFGAQLRPDNRSKSDGPVCIGNKLGAYTIPLLVKTGRKRGTIMSPNLLMGSESVKVNYFNIWFAESRSIILKSKTYKSVVL